MINVTVNFYQKRDKRSVKNSSVIYCYVRWKTEIINLHTGESVPSKYWDVKSQIVKKSFVGSPELNEYLTTYKQNIHTIVRIAKTENLNITFTELKEIILQKIKGIEKHNFFDVYDLYIKTKSPTVTKATITKFNSIKTHLLNFESATKSKITFDSIDIPFFDLLQNYFIDIKLSNNYIKKVLSFFKSFLHWSYDRSYTTNDKFKQVQNIKEVDTVQIALSKEELQRFIDVQLDTRLSKVRDCFLFQLYTGQRYSDISIFDITDVKNDVWFLKQTKTSKAVEIPIITPALQILAKYNYKLPLLSNVKMNEYLKEIGKLANINDMIKITKSVGAEKIETVQPKYELITTHTARRTFVSLSAYSGMQNDVIMSMTGHGSDKMVSKYFKTNTDETRNLIENLFCN
jgi:integrase